MYNICTSDISFEDNSFKFKSRTILSESTVPGLTRFLLKKGIVKNEKQANIFMIFMSIVFFCLAVYVFAFYVFDVRISNNINDSEAMKEKIQLNKERVQKLRDQQLNKINTQNAQ